LLLIDKLGDEIEINHSRAVTQWQNSGRNGECPTREQPPLDRLFDLFTEIFPSITLEYNSSNKQLRCKKNGQVYPPSQLSDGEKQIFSLLADIVILGGDNRLVLADEPELNLNPGLANRFWDLIEYELPNSVFVYATHSVSFAMRANVERVFVLSNENSNITEIKNIAEIDAKELPAFLGSIPAILSSTKAVVVEGRENSLDTLVYRWLIKQKDVEIVPVGGCKDVKDIANKTGVWTALAPSVKILGVIDRDFRSEDLLSSENFPNCVVLPYHEIESYLCHPKLIYQVASKIGNIERIPTEVELLEFIVEEFKKLLVPIVARRVSERATIQLGVSIPRHLLSQITDQSILESTFLAAAEQEVGKASTKLSSESIKKIIEEEFKICNEAVLKKSVNELLRLMPAKNLLKQLAQQAGCKDGIALARAAIKYVNVNEIDKLKELQDKLSMD
jgi:energy-coupling factor transporter ATP-binding protein EcfA2